MKKAQTIPWLEIEKRYVALFTNRKGNVAKPLRLALGACIIQAEYGFSDKETALQVHKVLHRLSEPYKEVFSLRVFGELSFGTISSLFGKSESWARVTYHRACKKIREELDHEDQL